MGSEAPIRERKREHLDICVREPVEHRRKTTLLEDVELIVEDFAVRRYAPDVAILGNIGVSQVASSGPEVIVEMCRRIDADALCVHLNALMELVQREGDRDFPDRKRLCAASWRCRPSRSS
jgi:isopentenyl diphosphate isomerase/L-lactate dehydrogenase-like FMN-dependent dehydrogenase